MRKNLAILLISIHLIGNTEAGQLLKFPQLLHHFFQHHQIDPSISFFQFMAMHYGGDDGTTADDDFDNQLPCHNPVHTTLAHVYSPMVKDILPAEIIVPETTVYSSRLLTGVSSEHVLLILQPPKQA